MRSFVKYVRRLNPKGVSLFQKAGPSPINGMYYDNASVGHNKLGTFMTEISRMTKLSREYTNHSCRIASSFKFTDRKCIEKSTSRQ